MSKNLTYIEEIKFSESDNYHLKISVIFNDKIGYHIIDHFRKSTMTTLKASRVLSYGCGYGHYTIDFELNYNYYNLDHGESLSDDSVDYFYPSIIHDFKFILEFLADVDLYDFEKLAYKILEDAFNGFFGQRLDEMHHELKFDILRIIGEKLGGENSDFFKLASEIYNL